MNLKEPVEFLTEAQVEELLAVLAKRDNTRKIQRIKFNQWRKTRGKEPYPDYEQLELVFTDYLTPLVKLVLNTGLRFGEAISLKWSDISKDGVLSARSSKTGNFRYFPLVSDSQIGLSHLKRLNKANSGINAQQIFVNESGEPIKSVKTAWNNIRFGGRFNPPSFSHFWYPDFEIL